MPCEISYRFVIVVVLIILIIYNWREEIHSHFIPEHMKEVPQFLGHGRPPGSGGGPLSLTQVQTGTMTPITETVSLNSDGGWTKSAQGGYTTSGTIPADLARKILTEAEKKEPSVNAGNCVDCFRYEVRLTYPSTQVVRKVLDQSVFPSSLGF